MDERLLKCQNRYPGYEIKHIFDGSFANDLTVGMIHPIRCFLHCIVRSTGVVIFQFIK